MSLRLKRQGGMAAVMLAMAFAGDSSLFARRAPSAREQRTPAATAARIAASDARQARKLAARAARAEQQARP